MTNSIPPSYWVAFPFRQYEPSAESLALKGIRIVRVDSTGVWTPRELRTKLT